VTDRKACRALGWSCMGRSTTQGVDDCMPTIQTTPARSHAAGPPGLGPMEGVQRCLALAHAGSPGEGGCCAYGLALLRHSPAKAWARAAWGWGRGLKAAKDRGKLPHHAASWPYRIHGPVRQAAGCNRQAGHQGCRWCRGGRRRVPRMEGDDAGRQVEIQDS
jgi:hypothetical protein